MPTSSAPSVAVTTRVANSDAVDRIVVFFEQMKRQDLDSLDRIYDSNASFKDPFNEVQGLAEIRQVYRHMFDSMREPHFVVTGRVVQGAECFLIWNFLFRFKTSGNARLETVHGTSHLSLDAGGRILRHRDYWDAAEELYEKIPVLGVFMGFLKRRVNR